MKDNNWQFVSLELAKKMKELGFEQESLFKWHSKLDDRGNIVHTEIIYFPAEQMEQDVSAYTVAELLEFTPTQIGEGTWFTYTKSLNGWGGICERVGYDKWKKNGNNLLIEHVHEMNTLPYKPPESPNTSYVDLLAKMLIYLKENNLLK